MGFGMKETYKENVYASEIEALAELEWQRNKRSVRKKKEKRQRRKRRLQIGAVLVSIAILAVFLVPKEGSTLNGTWAYGETATIQFSGKNSGAITLSDTVYPFTYTVSEHALQLYFDNVYIIDATYTFTVATDTLTLSGGAGTAGGTYTLTKIKK